METTPSNTIDKNRRPTWMRVLDVMLRTAHIGVAGILLGGLIFQVSYFNLQIWHNLTIITGFGLLMLELRHSLSWPHQVRGLVGIVHIGLPGLAHLFPALVVPLTWGALVTGGVGSHMSRKLRHWSIVYRKVVD